jgi:hypothetical protein
MAITVTCVPVLVTAVERFYLKGGTAIIRKQPGTSFVQAGDSNMKVTNETHVSLESPSTLYKRWFSNPAFVFLASRQMLKILTLTYYPRN